MNYIEFLARADLMVEKAYPEWYVEGVGVAVSFDDAGRHFASTHKLDDGTFAIKVYELAWDLCTVEDLASVLLHEYVHVKIWNELELEIPEPWCNVAVHELTAYEVESTQTKINVSKSMRVITQMGYNLSYAKGANSCPSELIEQFPAPRGIEHVLR
jgi:hypothetical protein